MNAPLDPFHPLIRDWFAETYPTPTDIQARAWPVIARGEHALITAPTGSGKTLTAFLYALDRLISGAWPPGATRVLYVSPMKALNNDIRRNLSEPLQALRTRFDHAGVPFPDIRVQTRSGDTPAEERRRMAKQPPEILITTPESLNLLHSSPKSRHTLAGIRTVILDEVHALAATKRGVHLFTAIERLLLYNGEFQRIALSATVKPLQAVAELVGGYRCVPPITPSARTQPEDTVYERRPVCIVESSQAKAYELRVKYPPVRTEPPDDGSRWPVLTDALRDLLTANTSTLIFTNTRRHCERISMLLNDREDPLRVYAHHGSLSREIRAVVERRLKEGDLDAIVATNSLELGIDIGDLDQVVLVQTPFSVASTLQRLGRAGHRVGEVSRGVLFPLFGRDLLEAAVMAQAVDARDIETLRPVRNALDVLAQVILSMTGVDRWNLDALFAFIRTAAAYRQLSRAHFDLVIAMLRGRYEGTRIRALQPLVSIDVDTNTIEAKPAALRTIYSSGGTIPDRGLYNLRLSDSNAKIGELDEEFVWERHLGETFTLGNQMWKIQAITHNDVLVSPGGGALRQVPFWKADTISRGFHFSERTAEFLEAIDPQLTSPKLKATLQRDCALDEPAADALLDFLRRQREATGGPLPHRHHLLVERCTDLRKDSERTQLILHTLWGGAVNRPIALAMAQAWEERTGESAEVFADNDCIVFVLSDRDADVDPFALLNGLDLEVLLRRKLEQTGLFGARFRENAARALLLPRQAFGKRMPLWMNRIRSKRLLDAVAGYDDFPILIETWRTCMQDEFELDQAKALLREVNDGVIRRSDITTTVPSPFATGIEWGQTNKYMYEGDAPPSPIESKLREDLFQTVVHSQDLRPQLDPALCRTFRAKAQRVYPGYAPAPGTELRDWVAERLYLPNAEWAVLRAAVARDHGVDEDEVADSIDKHITTLEGGIVANDALARFRAASGDAPDAVDESREFARDVWLAEWLRFYGPVQREVLVDILPFPFRDLLDELIDSRSIVAGHLTIGAKSDEICDAENLEILLRLSRRAQQAEVRARPLSELPLFIAQMQGLTQRDADILDAVEQLLGLPCDPALLETEYLPARVAAYRPAMLDEALSNAGLMWIGQPDKRVWFTARETYDLFAETQTNAAAILPSPIGRYTFSELLDHTGANSSDLTQRLWDAAWSGAVTNDSYEALRAGIRTKFSPSALEKPQRLSRRSGFRSWRATRPFAGHWHATPAAEPAADELDELERAKDRVRVLLDRYGILFRPLLQNERAPLRWAAVFRALRIMELGGEVVTGHFFDGIPGLQFMAASTVTAFQATLPNNAVYWMNATDPASLCGIDLEPLKPTLPRRLKSTHLVFHGPELKLISERGGKALHIRADATAPDLPRYFELFQHLLTRAVSPRSAVNIETINGEPATQSEYLSAFREAFEVHADPKRVSLYKRRTALVP